MGITQHDTQQSTQLRTMFEADFPDNMDSTNKVRETRAWNELHEEFRTTISVVYAHASFEKIGPERFQWGVCVVVACYHMCVISPALYY